jgi:hypothetical protein
VDHDFALLTLTLNHDRYAVPASGKGAGDEGTSLNVLQQNHSRIIQAT